MIQVVILYYTLSGKILQLIILYYTLSGANIRTFNKLYLFGGRKAKYILWKIKKRNEYLYR